jgi:hypothetical protein
LLDKRLPNGGIDADATDYIKGYARRQSLNKVKIHVILVVMKQQAGAWRRQPGNWGVKLLSFQRDSAVVAQGNSPVAKLVLGVWSRQRVSAGGREWA